MTESTAPKRPLRRDAQLNREKLLAAAAELLSERGIAVTLDDIAARAGVGVGTAYRRYPNKDALLDDLYEKGFEELVARSEALLAEPHACNALVGFLYDTTERFARIPALAAVLASGRRHESVAHARSRLDATLKTLIERAKADGDLRPDFEIADIGMIRAMIAGVVNATHKTDPDAWRRYLEIIVDGITTHPTTAASSAQPYCSGSPT
jgi:AcrR family transcriptional regulator